MSKKGMTTGEEFEDFLKFARHIAGCGQLAVLKKEGLKASQKKKHALRLPK